MRTVIVSSDDGAVRFLLRRVAAGLLVRRERRRPEGLARLSHSAVFADSVGFGKWCDSDSIRFDYPVVFSKVRREGAMMLQDREPDAQSPVDHD